MRNARSPEWFASSSLPTGTPPLEQVPEPAGPPPSLDPSPNRSGWAPPLRIVSGVLFVPILVLLARARGVVFLALGASGAAARAAVAGGNRLRPRCGVRALGLLSHLELRRRRVRDRQGVRPQSPVAGDLPAQVGRGRDRGVRHGARGGVRRPRLV